jgi:hypothetical protein
LAHDLGQPCAISVAQRAAQLFAGFTAIIRDASMYNELRCGDPFAVEEQV